MNNYKIYDIEKYEKNIKKYNEYREIGQKNNKPRIIEAAQSNINYCIDEINKIKKSLKINK